MHTYNVVACSLDLTFNSDADEKRVRKAIELVQKSYDSLRSHGSQIGRDRLLAILAIGIADDLLQLQDEHDKMSKVSEKKDFEEEALQTRLERILQMVDSSLEENK